MRVTWELLPLHVKIMVITNDVDVVGFVQLSLVDESIDADFVLKKECLK